MHITLQPRLIRLKDAPSYLGMDRHRFNKEIRPNITEIPIGTQGIAFDRLDLDAWVEDYKHRSDRPAETNHRRLEIWDEKERQDSIKEAKPGTLIKRYSDIDFAKALALSSSKKQKSF